MTKKIVIISGIIALAAAAAAAVAYFLLGKTDIFDKWNLDIDDDELIF
ncbi:MAG: hypothetical protein HDT42_13520 [Ruminococcaceae bacterium]|nr:hypothetical protein [Oscillospiraceae bacterium]